MNDFESQYGPRRSVNTISKVSPTIATPISAPQKPKGSLPLALLSILLLALGYGLSSSVNTIICLGFILLAAVIGFASKHTIGKAIGGLVGGMSIIGLGLVGMYALAMITTGPKCEAVGGKYLGGDIGCVDPSTRQYIDIGTGERRSDSLYTGDSLD